MLLLAFLCWILTLIPSGFAQESLPLLLINPLEKDRPSEWVSIPLLQEEASLFAKPGVYRTQSGQAGLGPAQLDDLDGDGQVDEAFLFMSCQARARIRVALLPEPEPPTESASSDTDPWSFLAIFLSEDPKERQHVLVLRTDRKSQADLEITPSEPGPLRGIHRMKIRNWKGKKDTYDLDVLCLTSPGVRWAEYRVQFSKPLPEEVWFSVGIPILPKEVNFKGGREWMASYAGADAVQAQAVLAASSRGIGLTEAHGGTHLLFMEPDNRGRLVFRLFSSSPAPSSFTTWEAWLDTVQSESDRFLHPLQVERP